MSGKSQTVGDFIVSRPSQILPTNENIPDRLELSRTNLENRECFYFSGASQISAMVGDYSRQMKPQICTVGDVGDGFRGYMLLISLITNALNCWAPVLLSQINMASLRQCPIYRQHLARSAKS